MESLTAWIEALTSFLVGGIAEGSYPGIVLLMTIESSFIPFPSEIVMIPAGYAAYHGDLNVWGVLGCGIIGSMLGALVNYFLAAWVGRSFLHRYGHRMFIPTQKLEQVERFFFEYGDVTTFVGRLIPGVRQLISIPAGLAAMDLKRFAVFTAAGAGLWVAVLTWFGYWLASKQLVWQAGWAEHKSQITLGALVLVGVVSVIYGLYRLKSRRYPEAGIP